MIRSTILTIGIMVLSSALCFCQSSNVPEKSTTKAEIKERLAEQKKAYKEALKQYEKALEKAREELEDGDARILREYLAELPRAPRAPRAPHALHYFNLPEAIEIPDIHVDIPDIPDINVVVPDIDFPHMDGVFAFDGDVVVPDVDFPIHFESFSSHDHPAPVLQFGGSRLMRDLTDDEQLRIQALRSVSRQRASKAIPALKKRALEDESPAVRYSAVKHLARFIDDERIVPILGKVVKNDDHIDVRKLAIRILGKSGNPEAVKILEEIVSR